MGGVKVGRALKENIQVVQSAEDDIYGSCKIEVVTGMVDVFYQVPSTTMAEHQAKDNQLAPVLEWVREGKSPTKAAIYQVRSKNTRQLMYQFHRLILKDGVLHRLYIHNDVEYHQLVLPQRYHKKSPSVTTQRSRTSGDRQNVRFTKGKGLLAYNDSGCQLMGRSM